MNVLELFLKYAGAFEQTVNDDDWERFERVFDSDAVYEVESRIAGATMVGPETICAGIRRSLGGQSPTLRLDSFRWACQARLSARS